MDNRLRKIGKNIRRIRKEKQLCQIDLAVTVGIDRSYLSEIENGRTNTSINVLFAIADALDVSMMDLINNNE